MQQVFKNKLHSASLIKHSMWRWCNPCAISKQKSWFESCTVHTIKDIQIWFCAEYLLPFFVTQCRLWQDLTGCTSIWVACSAIYFTAFWLNECHCHCSRILIRARLLL